MSMVEIFQYKFYENNKHNNGKTDYTSGFATHVVKRTQNWLVDQRVPSTK